MNITLFYGITLFIAVSLWCVTYLAPLADGNNKQLHHLPAKLSRIVGHRGLIRHAPENTLAGFGACIDLRMGFELDVRRSRDGQLVCIHDSTLNRTTDGKGEVGKFSLQALRKLDAGRWFDPAFAGQQVPTLEEVFSLLKSRKVKTVLVAVDIKAADDKVEGDCVRLAIKHGVLEQLLFIGRTIANPGVRRRLRKASLAAHVAVLAQKPADLRIAQAAPDADWIYVRFVPTRVQVRTIHKAGKRVFIAGPTVSGDHPANWQKAVSAGVDAILTDFPVKLRQTIRVR